MAEPWRRSADEYHRMHFLEQEAAATFGEQCHAYVAVESIRSLDGERVDPPAAPEPLRHRFTTMDVWRLQRRPGRRLGFTRAGDVEPK
jgi:hypothetical protein